MKSAKAAVLELISEWSAGLGAAVQLIGEEGFCDALHQATRQLVPVDSAMILAYRTRRRLDLLLDASGHAERTNQIDTYLKGAYLLDPFFIHTRGRQSPGLMRMSDIAPEDFESTDYFRHYYKGSGVSDEVNIICPVSDDVCIAYSLERAARNCPFSGEDIALFEAISPLVSSLAAKHWQALHEQDDEDEPDPRHDRLLTTLANIGSDVLTARESQITQCVLKGHSNLSIGELLGVSVETVKVHRRNIYRKLNISSVSELYSIALSRLLQTK